MGGMKKAGVKAPKKAPKEKTTLQNESRVFVKDILSLEERIVNFTLGDHRKAIWGAISSWLRMGAALWLLASSFIQESIDAGLSEEKAQKKANRDVDAWVTRNFDQNVPQFKVSNLKRYRDLYGFVKPLVDRFWLAQDFDQTPESILENESYMDILKSLNQRTILEIGTVFSSEERKQLFGDMIALRKNVKASGFSEAFLFNTLKEKAGREIQRSAKKKGIALKKSKKPIEEKTGPESVKPQSRPDAPSQVVVELPNIPSSELTDRDKWSAAYCLYLDGVTFSLKQARESRLDDILDHRLVINVQRSIDMLASELDELSLAIDARLSRENLEIDRKNESQYKLKNKVKKSTINA